jgi:hypothetical protein
MQVPFQLNRSQATCSVVRQGRLASSFQTPGVMSFTSLSLSKLKNTQVRAAGGNDV